MKNLSSGFIILSTLIISCTTDNDVQAKKQSLTDAATISVLKAQEVNPENTSNAYDVYGKAHSDILDIYENDHYNYPTIGQISGQVEVIVGTGTFFPGLGLNDGVAVTSASISQLVNSPAARAKAVIENSNMAAAAKISFEGFVDYLILHDADDYEKNHSYIIQYEAVVSGSAFNTGDKKAILIASSISRYSLFRSKRRKDKDWETSVGNIVGGVEGSLENEASAVKKAVVAGIAFKTSVTN